MEPTKIRLARLTLSNHRNFAETDLELSPGLSLFQGMNGHGKSNLLEAVYMLSVARSPRASQDRAVVSWDVINRGGHCQLAGVAREIEQTTKVQIDFEVTPANGDSVSVQKSLRVNGVPRSASDFVGSLNVVAFAAEDIELVTGSPSRRRRYLDILISQSDPSYLKALQRYQKVVTQRNNLLRLIRERRASLDELTFWDERLCQEAAAIVERRAVAIDQLRGHAAEAHTRLADGDDSLGLTYRPELGPGETPDSMTASTLTETLNDSLGALRDREIARAITMVGPHRDELELTLTGNSAGAYASRGQARTIALALKLAEGKMVSEATDRKTILALDDVLSELDADRRSLVLEASREYEQVFVTATDLSLVEPRFLDGADKYLVNAGTVERIDG